MKERYLKQKIGFFLIKFSVFFTLTFLLLFLSIMFIKGTKVLSWEFLFSSPKNFMTEGGIFPALLGTIYLVLLSISFSIPIGVLTAIYLVFYAKSSYFVRIIKTSVHTLSGIPSIIYGLFGLSVFVNLFHFKVSILSGSLTLAILSLPVIIAFAQEALKSVPNDFIEAAYGLGATKLQTLTKLVLPTAMPSILTGIIIVIGRIAGETAPILFTATTFYSKFLPSSIMDETMALPYHIYALLTEGTNSAKQVPIAYGTALVLLLLVSALSSLAIIIRYKIRKKRLW